MVPAMRRSNLVSFQKMTEQASTEGFNAVEVLVEQFQAWVSISPNRGDEQFTADERVSVVTHTVRGDFGELSEVTPDMVMIFHPTGSYSPIPTGSRMFDIVAVMHDEDMHADTMIKVQEKPRGYGV